MSKKDDNLSKNTNASYGTFPQHEEEITDRGIYADRSKLVANQIIKSSTDAKDAARGFFSRGKRDKTGPGVDF